MAIELNTLQNRVNVQEQAICDAHRRVHAETMASQQADAEEQLKKDTKKLDERTRLLALSFVALNRVCSQMPKPLPRRMAMLIISVKRLMRDLLLLSIEQDVETISLLLLIDHPPAEEPQLILQPSILVLELCSLLAALHCAMLKINLIHR